MYTWATTAAFYFFPLSRRRRFIVFLHPTVNARRYRYAYKYARMCVCVRPLLYRYTHYADDCTFIELLLLLFQCICEYVCVCVTVFDQREKRRNNIAKTPYAMSIHIFV